MADLQQYNIVGQFQQGYDRGRAQLSDKLAGQAFGAQGADRQSALSRLAGVNPDAALTMQGKFQQQEVDHAKKINGAARYVLQAVQSGDPNRIQGAYQAVRPYLAELGASQGKVPPEQFDPSMLPKIYEIVGQTGGDAITSGSLPTGFREFQMTAEAAGLKPGTPEYQQAANIALGREGRASSAGIGFQKVTGADGRERIGRTNPRTGAFEVYNEQTGQFEPMGGPMGAQGAQSAPDAIQTLLQQANQAVRMGADPARVDQWLQQQTAQIGGVQVQPAANPALAVSRAPEDTAYAKERATQRAQLEALPQQEAIKAQAAIKQAGGQQAAKAQASRLMDRPQAEFALHDATASLDRLAAEANTIINHPGLGGITGLRGSIPDVPGTDAANARAELQTLKSQVGFGALQAMRAASKTGGALGSVSEKENELLQSNIAALQTAQSKEQFIASLKKIIQYADGAKSRLQSAFNQTYSGQVPSQPDQSGGVDDLLSKYGAQ